MLNGWSLGSHVCAHSGVAVAWKRRARLARRPRTPHRPRTTLLCPSWPVMPSGPNVSTVSGCTSRMISTTCRAPVGSSGVCMSTSIGPSRNRCSSTPSTSRLRRISTARTRPALGGPAISSIDPPSPRVAVTSTTRFPAAAATARDPTTGRCRRRGAPTPPRIVPSSRTVVVYCTTGARRAGPDAMLERRGTASPVHLARIMTFTATELRALHAGVAVGQVDLDLLLDQRRAPRRGTTRSHGASPCSWAHSQASSSSTSPRSFAVSHNAFWSAFLPRCRRDITVPMGCP